LVRPNPKKWLGCPVRKEEKDEADEDREEDDQGAVKKQEEGL